MVIAMCVIENLKLIQSLQVTKGVTSRYLNNEHDNSLLQYHLPHTV